MRLFEAQPLTHEIKWSPLHFSIDAAKVFTHDAERDQLHTTDEHQPDEQPRPSRDHTRWIGS